MDTGEYRAAVTGILGSASHETAARLEKFRAAARAEGTEIDGIVIDVFVDQDGEGPFDVWARFDGRDAFVLDRRFDDARHLFGVVWGEAAWEPAVPPRPRSWTRDDLEAAVVDVVTRWIEPLLPAGEPEEFWRIGPPA
ncbi:DUF6389 family protein [Amycolatopsis silviterrae]|uniref:DUF6389 family protein n=1 Tax=Amycolatopsis silviterrae TaxID=1656914 RepID=A0ABW5H367_9PSEU